MVPGTRGVNHSLHVTLLFSRLLFLQLSYGTLALNTPAPSGACSTPGRCEEHGVGGPGGTSAQGITPWHPEDPGAAPLWLPGPRGKHRGTQEVPFCLSLCCQILSACDRPVLPLYDFTSLLSVMIQNA